MSTVPFALRRPWLLVRDLLVDRERPDLLALGRLTDPERFLWAILPHAARTFSACIALLPARAAKASAVAYLYCRILDTYEDLSPTLGERLAALDAFAARFAPRGSDDALPAAPPLTDVLARDARDKAHLLLVQRCDLIDRVYRRLPADVQRVIADLVQDMAAGMAWGARTFDAQGGLLRDEAQLMRYCRAVLGNPVLYVARLSRLASSGSAELTADEREATMVSGEFIQLANVTRDIEKDLARGVAFDERLAGDLVPTSAPAPAGPDALADARMDPPADAEHPLPADASRAERVRVVREHQLVLALRRAPAYAKLVTCLDSSRFSLTRASAVLMLLFTDRYYRSCAVRAGRRSWGPRPSGLALLCRTLPAVVSRGWTRRLVDRTVADLVTAADDDPDA